MSAFETGVKTISRLLGITAAGRALAEQSIPMALSTEDNALLDSLAGPRWVDAIAYITGDDASHTVIDDEGSAPITANYLLSDDTDLSLSASGNNNGASSDLIAGYSGVGHRKIIARGDFSAVPSGAIVTAASFSIYNKDAASTLLDHTLIAHRILAANAGWVEGNKSYVAATLTDPSWAKKSQSPSVNWAGSAGLSTSGTDYSATELGTVEIYDTEPGWRTISLDLEEFALMLADNDGMVLDTVETTDGAIATYRSRSSATTGERPFFTVTTAVDGADVLSAYLIASDIGATWHNDDAASALNAPIPTAGITVPVRTNERVSLSIYVPVGVTVWYGFLK